MLFNNKYKFGFSEIIPNTIEFTIGKDILLPAGVDEVGRGCLAGNVVAAAVILPLGFYDPRIKDSKTIKSLRKMEEAELIIRENAIAIGIGEATPEEIDRLNISGATFLAMERAIRSIEWANPDFLYIDGDRFPGFKGISHECVIKGDSKVHCISAASIIAKSHRDRIMKELDSEYSEYKWITNVGYGTAAHIEGIKKIGLSKHHRRSFCQNFI
jgi:ribonuclease HII